jgi:hypothetical protein
MCVILAGAPWDGFQVHGPFADGCEAERYQQEHLYSCDFWWIMPITKEV